MTENLTADMIRQVMAEAKRNVIQGLVVPHHQSRMVGIKPGTPVYQIRTLKRRWARHCVGMRRKSFREVPQKSAKHFR